VIAILAENLGSSCLRLIQQMVCNWSNSCLFYSFLDVNDKQRHESREEFVMRICTVLLGIEYDYIHQIKEDELSVVCVTHREIKNVHKIFVRMYGRNITPLYIYCNGFDQRVARQQLCKHGPTRNSRRSCVLHVRGHGSQP
jgi:hypothetical protein